MHLPALFARRVHAVRADETVVETLANSRSLTGPLTLTTTVLSNPVPANTVSAPVTRLTRPASSATAATTTSASGGGLPTITVTQTVPIQTSSASASAVQSSAPQTTAVATDPLSSTAAISSSPASSPASTPSALSSLSAETSATGSEAAATTPAVTFSDAVPTGVSSAVPVTSSRSVAGANTPVSTPVPTGSIGADTSGVKPQGVGAASKSSIPVAAIVVPVLLVVLLALGLLVFFIRRRAVKNRLRRRNTWGAGKYQTPDFRDTERAYEAARRANVAPNVGEEAKPVAPFVAAAPRPPPVAPAPPQMSYNNNPPPPLLASSAYPFPPPVTLAPALASGASTTASPLSIAVRGLAPAPAGPSALVRYTFIPTLPDELHISSGERVRILTEYDDGWALCENGAGEQGMVPLECLDRSGSPGGPGGLNVPPSPAASYRSKRASSLAAGSGIRPPNGQQNRYF